MFAFAVTVFSKPSFCCWMYIFLGFGHPHDMQERHDLFKHEVVTHLKFNMEPEKKSLEKVIPFGNHHFQVPC